MTLPSSPCEIDNMSLFQDLKLKRRKVDSRCSSDGKNISAIYRNNGSRKKSPMHVELTYIACLSRKVRIEKIFPHRTACFFSDLLRTFAMYVATSYYILTCY